MNHENVTRYPLCWPAGQPRTNPRNRISGQFKVTQAVAQVDLCEEVERMRGARLIVSINVEVRRDGLPYSNQRTPEDPGVAVYFTRNGRPVCFACDQYTTIAANIRAISKTIEALRGIERWGGAQLMDRAFTGFMALPAPMTVPEEWWQVLGVAPDASEEAIRAAKIRLSRDLHPDMTGGDPVKAERLALVNAAADEGLRARRRVGA